jgi:hypothetical protein
MPMIVLDNSVARVTLRGMAPVESALFIWAAHCPLNR